MRKFPSPCEAIHNLSVYVLFSENDFEDQDARYFAEALQVCLCERGIMGLFACNSKIEPFKP